MDITSTPTRRQCVAEYPEPRPEWAQRAEARGATASFPAWLHQKPAPASTPLPLPVPVPPDPWATKHMAAAGPNTPMYGTPEWSALDDNSPEKAAACVQAAQQWLEARDPAVIAERMRAERAEIEAELRAEAAGTVEAVARRVAQQVEPFSPAREVVQTPDWPPIAQPGRPVPAPVAVEPSAVAMRALPSVPTASVTAETRPVQAAARAADPVRRASPGAAPRSPAQPAAENKARAYWEQRRVEAHASRGAGQGRG